jgi:hypothetical protein
MNTSIDIITWGIDCPLGRNCGISSNRARTSIGLLPLRGTYPQSGQASIRGKITQMSGMGGNRKCSRCHLQRQRLSTTAPAGWEPRTSRMIVPNEKAVYHVMSRTALDGFPLADVEKDFLLGLIKQFSALYFTEISGFCSPR